MARKQNLRIAHYFLALYLLLVLILSKNLYLLFSLNDTESPVAFFYAAAALASYAFLYLAPGVLTLKLLQWLLLKLPYSERTMNRRLGLVDGVMVLIGWLTLLLIYADSELFALYNYHFDDFVWNLITTPGGIESLGATSETMATFGLIVAGFLALAAGLFWGVKKVVKGERKPFFRPRLSLAAAFAILFIFALVEETFYGVSTLFRKYEYTQASVAFPFFLNTSFNSFATSLGVKVESNKMRISTGKIVYPLEPVKASKPEKPLNIVWLVAESLRSDMLSPRIMPRLWSFSESTLRFSNHYSGGNRTRMGLLSMFYGLYAPYWYAVQQQRVSPILMDVLLDQGYQMSVHTSQSFSYPELYDTVFAKVPRSYMHELNQDKQAWKNDTKNITDILTFLDGRDKSRPFFTFMFFESTHAPYHFPEESVIERDYLDNMNYARLNLTRNASKIKNRYLNAAHFLDSQAARVIDYLERHDLLDSTIVLFTGDHGEEFMEKGHWGHGHNAHFPQEQIRVPLVIHLPGAGARQVDYMTSHLDIPATLLPYLGARSPAEDYSLGHDMLAPEYHRDHTVIGNYDYITYLDEKYKLTFPFKGHSDRIAIRSQNDQLVSVREQAALIKAYENSLARMIDDANKFTRKTPR